MSETPTGPADGGAPRGRFTIVYLIHEAFRRDLGRLSQALRSPRLHGERVTQLGGHWGFLHEQLHHHHQVEDDSLWPLVRPKLAGRDAQLAVLDQMEAQHHELLPEGEAIGDDFTTLAARPSGAAAEQLAGRIDRFGVRLGAHLEDEEQHCFPVIDEAMTDEEFSTFGKATAKAVGMRGSATFFPWIFDGADPRERAEVLSMPPPPVRVLCQLVWEPSYRRRSADLWS
jgi:iron-sulfur cluster repair protein YtfE (RIC family)